jgi:rRNA maturation RNase YbeY
MVRFNFLEIDDDILDRHGIKQWLKLVIKSEKKINGNIQFIFCNDEFLLGINQAYLDHDTYTDIITFPTSQNASIISGEIYISIERVMENAISRNLKFEFELSRVMVHGILHLMGYHDTSKAEQSEMRAKEDYYLNLQP